MLHQQASKPTALPHFATQPRDIRVLLLDDSDFDRKRIRRFSTRTDLPIQLDEVGSIADMDAAVAQTHYDLILIDYRLPEGDGILALDRIQKSAMNRGAGKIMITGNANTDTAVAAMRAGCHDFLAKDSMNPDLLRHAMIKAMQLAQQRELMAMQIHLHSEMIREGMLASLQDSDVQDAIGNAVARRFKLAIPQNAGFVAAMDPGAIDALLAAFGTEGEDKFIFH